MLGMTLYLTQAASDNNSLLHWCDGVCWQWQYVTAHGPYPYIRLIIQLTHRNMSTKIKQMIKKKNDKKIEVQQQSQYESLYNILTINKELLM